MATATRKGGGKSSAKRGSGTSARRGGGSASGRSQSARGGNRGNAGRASAKGRTTGRAATRSTGGRSDQSRKTARGAARATGRSASGRSGKSAGGGRARSAGGGSRSSQATVDHDQIRQWAEDRGGQPSCVRGTGGGDDVGMLRIDFPGYSGADSLQPISWDEFFEKFDERGLALVYQDTTRGQKSNFNKLVSRDDPKVRKQLGGATAGRK